MRACGCQRLNREKEQHTMLKFSVAKEMLHSWKSLIEIKIKHVQELQRCGFQSRLCFRMVTVMRSDWAKEEEKLVVFKSSDLRGCNSWYSGFPRVYQLRAVLSSGWEYRRALQPCELSEALKMPFLNLSANLNKQLMLNSAKTFPKWLSDELCVLPIHLRGGKNEVELRGTVAMTCHTQLGRWPCRMLWCYIGGAFFLLKTSLVFKSTSGAEFTARLSRMVSGCAH